ncbi:hypothetical protein PIIN_08781 [Serendipita indica DSM 11827]|uniref:Uncharacterized protein n=1 Tax=Serendipita indica (strain DSM 11827) TaxID=1109443 RepID=G4TU19_SERID|nr:hypothetical protein PIIN_08781 [Serendipita indica DSM 11827]
MAKRGSDDRPRVQRIYKLPVPGSAATTRDGVAGVVEWGWIEKQSQCCSNARELTGSARRRKRGEYGRE